MTRKKILLCTPAYTGSVDVPYAVSYAETAVFLDRMGILLESRINVINSLLVAGRNNLVADFMEADHDYILFVDSDIGWHPSYIQQMLEHDEEFVAGIYPSRKDNTFMFRPIYDEKGAIVGHPSKSLLKMEAVPAGFMLLKRSAIEKMYEKHKQFAFHKDNETNRGVMLFNTEFIDGNFWGEDYIFCKRAQEAGIDIWVDPRFTFNHAGVLGCLMSVLTDKKPEES